MALMWRFGANYGVGFGSAFDSPEQTCYDLPGMATWSFR